MIGIDEVGRGCWAGPLLVVAARQTGPLPENLHDSKQMTKRQRNAVYGLLSDVCYFGEGWVSVREIDKNGLAHALKLGVKRALNNLPADPNEEVILDGKVNYLPKRYINGRCQIGADNLVPIVSAASVYAKVTRDRFMVELAKKYPLYYFEKHVGYGTKKHLEALDEYGPLQKIHRYSFQPISMLINPAP